MKTKIKKVITKDLPRELWCKYYPYKYHCSNCLNKTLVWILKGFTVKKVENEIYCSVCGCTKKQTEKQIN